MVIAKSLFYFVLAGLCEIGGGYLVWLWLRENKSLWFAHFLRNCSNIPTSTLWKSLRCIWGDLYRYGYAVGLADRQDTTRQVRLDRSFYRAYRCLHYHVLAEELIFIM